LTLLYFSAQNIDRLVSFYRTFLKPGRIIPIHAFHPNKYGGLFSRKIEQVSDGEVFEV
jgi:ribonuclease J